MLEAKNIYKTFKDKTVLKNVNLNIEKGETVLIIGPSGSGKTTILKCLNMLITPDKGEIIFKNEKLTEENINKLREKVGMVFQQPNPFPMSIFDNIAYGPRIHGIKNHAELEKIVIRSLKQAALYDEIADRLDTSALGLSGGQQQRLCIARCLAVNPDVILLDEPTSALDPISTSKIEDLLMDLKKDYTIVIVTHNMQQASRIADNTAFFLQGEIIETGDTEKIFSFPQDKRTEDYITGRFG